MNTETGRQLVIVSAPVKDRSARYPIRQPAEIRVTRSISLPAETVNISSSGILLRLKPTHSFPPACLDGLSRSYVQVHVPWPARLDDGVRLKAIFTGRVVRISPPDLVAVKIRSYVFKTCKNFTLDFSQNNR